MFGKYVPEAKYEYYSGVIYKINEQINIYYTYIKKYIYNIASIHDHYISKELYDKIFKQ